MYFCSFRKRADFLGGVKWSQVDLETYRQDDEALQHPSDAVLVEEEHEGRDRPVQTHHHAVAHVHGDIMHD